MLMHEKFIKKRKTLSLTCNQKKKKTHTTKNLEQKLFKMCDQIFYTWAQKNNETRLNHLNMQLKINNYKVVIPCVTKNLIHETKRNLI